MLRWTLFQNNFRIWFTVSREFLDRLNIVSDLRDIESRFNNSYFILIFKLRWALFRNIFWIWFTVSVVSLDRLSLVSDSRDVSNYDFHQFTPWWFISRKSVPSLACVHEINFDDYIAFQTYLRKITLLTFSPNYASHIIINHSYILWG